MGLMGRMGLIGRMEKIRKIGGNEMIKSIKMWIRKIYMIFRYGPKKAKRKIEIEKYLNFEKEAFLNEIRRIAQKYREKN
jgi:hypothetical protein